MEGIFQVGQSVSFSFPIFELDGMTKKTGLVAANFSVIVTQNNIVISSSPLESAIAELASSPGVYGSSAMFSAEGLWRIEIDYGSGDQVIEFIFQVVSSTPWQASSTSVYIHD